MSNNHETLWNNQENSIEQNRHINSLMVRFIKQLTGKRKEFLPTASQTLAETPGLSLIQ